jgi:hypothetical protein
MLLVPINWDFRFHFPDVLQNSDFGHCTYDRW